VKAILSVCLSVCHAFFSGQASEAGAEAILSVCHAFFSGQAMKQGLRRS
jgi:ribosomal protein L31